MKNFLRTAVSLCALFAVLISQAQETESVEEASWKPIQKIVKEKQPGWRESLSETIEGVEEFADDYKTFTNAKTPAEKQKAALDNITARIDRYVDTENIAPKSKSTANVNKILARTEFKIAKDAPGKSWVEQILDRLNQLNKKRNTPNSPNLEFPNLPWLGPLLQGIMYLILATAIGVLIWLLTKLRFIGQERKSKVGKRGGILEEGEELLSEDEYLLNADDLIAKGLFREACRALYLAMLVRLDSSRVARLEPTQTNWEHLRRVEANRTKPEGLDFRTPTKLFDHAWYGYTARSAADVEPFRTAYSEIKALTEVKPS